MRSLKNKIVFIAALLVFQFFCGLEPAFGYSDNLNEIEIQVQEPEDLNSAVDEAIQNSTKEVETPVVEDIQVMTPNANEQVKKEVLKDTDNNLKFTIKKFIFAMIGVLISSILIFIILSLMNKLNAAGGMKMIRSEEENKLPREEPVSLSGENDALKIFFEKTR